MVSYDGLATYAYLCCKQTMFTHHDAVTEVYLAIDFCSLPNDGVTGYTFVDGTSCPDLYIVVQDGAATATPLYESFFCLFIVEGIR